MGKDFIHIAALVVMLVWLGFIYYKIRKIGKGLKELADELSKHKKRGV